MCEGLLQPKTTTVQQSMVTGYLGLYCNTPPQALMSIEDCICSICSAPYEPGSMV